MPNPEPNLPAVGIRKLDASFSRSDCCSIWSTVASSDSVRSSSALACRWAASSLAVWASAFARLWAMTCGVATRAESRLTPLSRSFSAPRSSRPTPIWGTGAADDERVAWPAADRESADGQSSDPGTHHP